MKVAQVLLPIAIKTTYSYLINSDELESRINVGSFVAVPIGKRRIVGGIVVEISEATSLDCNKLRSIESVIYEKSVVTQLQIDFWRWLSDYYLLPIGSISYNFLPSILKPSTNYKMAEDGEINYSFDSLTGFEQVALIYLNECYRSEEEIAALIQQLARKKRQYQLIIDILEQLQSSNDYNLRFSRKEFLTKGYSSALILQLVKSGVLCIESTSREKRYSLPSFTPLHQIESNSLAQSVANELGGGKTILIEAQNDQEISTMVVATINKALEEGGQVLFITPTLTRYSSYKRVFEKYFADNLIIYEKSANKNRQHQAYFSIINSKSGVVVLTNRMGVGLPFSNLKLVIVDREHDTLYNGREHEAPFNARDAAVYLAHIHRAQAILISIAPSVESIHNTEIGKYKLISQKTHFQQKIVAIDRRAIARSDKKMIDSSSDRRFLSKLIISEIEKRCSRGEKVLIYQNRKGFATTLECADCGALQFCDSCNSVLVYYKSSNSFKCRYCGKSYTNITQCRSCASHNIVKQGVGSENVEEKLKSLFPHFKVVRVDATTSEATSNFAETMRAIDSCEADIIIGTQLLTALPPISNLTMLAVVNGDNLFSLPDYKNNERAFQLLTTLRSMLINSKESLMILQMSPQGDFLKNFTDNNFAPLYHREIYERKSFFYPPFCRMIIFRIEHTDEQELTHACNRFVSHMRKYLRSRISEPTAPIVDKINNYYIREIVIKTAVGKEFNQAKQFALESVQITLRKIKYRIRIF